VLGLVTFFSTRSNARYTSSSLRLTVHISSIILKPQTHHEISKKYHDTYLSRNSLANNHRARSSKQCLLAFVSVGCLLLWTIILSCNHATVPCFGHLFSELFLQTVAVEVVFCFLSDGQKQWFVCHRPYRGLIFIMFKLIKFRRVRIDYSNKKQKFFLWNYNDMSLYVIVSCML
jgi:hypothetical protein